MDTGPPPPAVDTEDAARADGPSRPASRRWTMFAPLHVLLWVLAAWNLSITLRANRRLPPEETI